MTTLELAAKCLDNRLTGSQAVIAITAMAEFADQLLAERDAEIERLQTENKTLAGEKEDMRFRNELLRDRVDLPDELYAKRRRWYDKAMASERYREALDGLLNAVQVLQGELVAADVEISDTTGWRMSGAKLDARDALDGE